MNCHALWDPKEGVVKVGLSLFYFVACVFGTRFCDFSFWVDDFVIFCWVKIF
jgi:hypothetical protein